MVELFIIGNGFDLRHGMKTSYSDFRNYLEEHRPEDFRMITELFSDENDPGFLWSSFEEALGRTSNIDVEEMYNEITVEIQGKSTEEAFQIIQDRCSVISEPRRKIADLMLEWIRYAQSTASIEKRKGIHINRDDYSLIFNYTVRTIELYTKVEIAILDRFCYIHNNTAGGDLITGHNNPDQKRFNIEYRSQIKELDEWSFQILELHELYLPEEYLKHSLDNVNQILYKNPGHKIGQKAGFFEDIRIVDGITVLGWSLGSIDIPYMDAVMEHTRLDTPMIIVYYDQETRDRFERYFENRPDRACHVSYMTWDEYETRDV